MAETDPIVKCPYCGKESPYGDDPYDCYQFDFDHGTVIEKGDMRCKSCNRLFHVSVKYIFEEIATSI